MNKQEKIVCAAVKFEYMVHSEVVMCLDYNDNRVQDHISNDMAYGVIGERTNGFITNYNRFVDAKEAWEIAEDAEQINYDIIDYSCYEEKGYQELKPSDLY